MPTVTKISRGTVKDSKSVELFLKRPCKDNNETDLACEYHQLWKMYPTHDAQLFAVQLCMKIQSKK